MKRAQPSPLAGEGGARSAPGEGAAPNKARAPRKVPESIAFARSLRRGATEAEKKLWTLLRAPPFADLKFRRQVPIGPYTADFLSYSSRLVIEVDGSQHTPERDGPRDAWFDADGWRVLGLANATIVGDMRSAVEMIFSTLDAMGIALKDARDSATGAMVTTWEVKR